MGAFIKEIGSMIFKTVLERRGFSTKQSLVANTRVERSMVRENSNGLMDQSMRENLGMVNFMEKGHIFGLMIDDILVNGLMVRWRV